MGSIGSIKCVETGVKSFACAGCIKRFDVVWLGISVIGSSTQAVCKSDGLPRTGHHGWC
ncbi:Uncharacterised protein [Neisseria animalis]|nr:Uncharacterised protein [Neisseria animalis]